MKRLYAQGDILIEEVDTVPPRGATIAADETGATVLAEGEATGHRHRIMEQVTMFRDDGLARDMPLDLYIGHLTVGPDHAQVVHDEHDPIDLGPGTYRVRRQRELDHRVAILISD
jgi:hypothetical protein